MTVARIDGTRDALDHEPEHARPWTNRAAELALTEARALSRELQAVLGLEHLSGELQEQCVRELAAALHQRLGGDEER